MPGFGLNLSWSNIRQHPLTVFFVFVVFSFLVYGRVLHAPFHGDDHELMIAHPLVRTSPPLPHYWETGGRKALAYMTFNLNYRAGGRDPFGFHVVNVLIHAAAAFFFYLCLRLLFATPFLLTAPLLREAGRFSFFAALVFLLHPLQTQSVTYIWQRTESLSGLFFLMSYAAYLKGRLGKDNTSFYIAALLFGIGFFAKGIIVALPVLIAVTEASFIAPGQSRKIFFFLRPFLWAFLILAWIPFFPIHRWQTQMRFPFYYIEQFYVFVHDLFMKTGMHFSTGYLFTQMGVFFKYVQLAFFPANQCVDYHWPLARSFWEAPVLISFTGMVMLAFLTWRIFQRHRLMAFGVMWFFICLLPASLVYRQPIWEHRMYLSMAGFAIFSVHAIFVLIRNKKWRDGAIILFLCVLAVLTLRRNEVWRSAIGLMEDTVRKAPRNPRPQHFLGTLYSREGDLDRALHYLQKAIALDPDYPEANNNLGLVYFKKGDYEQAEKFYRKALEARPGFPDAYSNLASLYFEKGDDRQAEEFIRQGLGVAPLAEMYLILGNISMKRQDFLKAQKQYEEAIFLNSDNWQAFYGLGNAVFMQGNYSLALKNYEKSLAMNPEHVDTYLNIAMIYYYLNDFEKSILFLKEAARKAPQREDVQGYLRKVWESMENVRR